jgi:DNA-binding MarR family transcriptional regulator
MARRPPHLDRALSASTLQLLFKAARLANETAMSRVNLDAGRRVFRQSIANLLPHITFEGVRIGALADKVDVSKQAVSKVVAEMVEMGVVELAPDPGDARGKLVRFTAKGGEAIQHGLGVLRGLERELETELGAPAMRALHRTLERMLEVLSAAT